MEIENRISQGKQAINALNSVWWSKNITKNKLQIYQTIVQSILTSGAEVWRAVNGHHVIGPFFHKDTITSERYVSQILDPFCEELC